MIAKISKEEMQPILPVEVEDVCRSHMVKLIHATYLRSYTLTGQREMFPNEIGS